MSVCYLDASALVKLYLPEPGAAWVRSLVPAEVIVTSAVSVVEVACALRRRSMDGDLSFDECRQLFLTFLDDLRGFEVVNVSEDVLRRTASNALDARSLPLRALDAIHLAAARESFILFRRLESDQFTVVAADRRLRAAAAEAALRTDNPEDHA